MGVHLRKWLASIFWSHHLLFCHIDFLLICGFFLCIELVFASGLRPSVWSSSPLSTGCKGSWRWWAFWKPLHPLCQLASTSCQFMENSTQGLHQQLVQHCNSCSDNLCSCTGILHHLALGAACMGMLQGLHQHWVQYAWVCCKGYVNSWWSMHGCVARVTTTIGGDCCS